MPDGHRAEASDCSSRDRGGVDRRRARRVRRPARTGHAEAAERGLAVIVGAGFGPGLTDVLVAHARSTFDTLDEIHISRRGTGGPACAGSTTVAGG